MNTRLENLVMSGLVALAVSVSVSGATSPPINTQPANGPSAVDVNRAQAREIRNLKSDVALLKQNLNIVVSAINDTNQDVADLQNEMPCIDGGYQAAWDASGHLVANNDAAGPSNFVIPITSAECAS